MVPEVKSQLANSLSGHQSVRRSPLTKSEDGRVTGLGGELDTPDAARNNLHDELRGARAGIQQKVQEEALVLHLATVGAAEVEVTGEGRRCSPGLDDIGDDFGTQTALTVRSHPNPCNRWKESMGETVPKTNKIHSNEHYGKEKD